MLQRPVTSYEWDGFKPIESNPAKECVLEGDFDTCYVFASTLLLWKLSS